MLSHPRDMARRDWVDASPGRLYSDEINLYWMDDMSYPIVKRVPCAGGQSLNLAKCENQQIVSEIVPAQDNLYYFIIDESDVLKLIKTPIEPGDSKTIFTPPTEENDFIIYIKVTTDGNYLYWTLCGERGGATGQIMKTAVQ